MKDAVGGSLLLNIVVIFTSIVILFFAGIMAYSKAYKIKNRIIEVIERYETYDDTVEPKLEEDLRKLIENNVIITIGSKESAELADKIGKKLGRKVKAHIKVDTGFGRYGFTFNKRDEMIEALKNIQNIKIEGTFTHFSISFYDEKYTKLQFKRFIDVIEVLKMNKIETGMLHVCNSSAFLKHSNMHLQTKQIQRKWIYLILIQTQIWEKNQIKQLF